MKKLLFCSVFTSVLCLCPAVKAQIICSDSVIYDAASSGSTKLLTGVSTQKIYVCGFNFFAGGTVNVKLIYGTGGTCGSGTNSLTPAYQFTTQTGIVDHSAIYNGLKIVPSSNDLCINTNAGTAVQAIVYYKFF